MKKKSLYIGVMSGTSLNSVDVALCDFEPNSFELLASLEYPMPPEIRTAITLAIHEKMTLEELGVLDYKLGALFAKAVNALLAQENLKSNNIVAIGSHGQTLWHAPKGDFPFSMQIGNPYLINVESGIPVVAHFRNKDIALGGVGAPFAPAFHQFIYGYTQEVRAVVNIGGMANISILGKELLIGYDTGCGNVLMDLWIQRHLGKEYDAYGEWAQEGALCYPLLQKMLKDEYFLRPYPKSTGKEKFNLQWVDEKIQEVQTLEEEIHGELSNQDIQRVLLELTALTITNEITKFDVNHVTLAGGGAHNSFLVTRIKSLLSNADVEISQYVDDLEAMAFAWLAYKRINKEAINLKDVTGAKTNSLLGVIYE